MKKNNDVVEIEPILVKNPIDNKYYNIAPLFSAFAYGNDNFEQFEGYLQNVCDMLPYLFKEEYFGVNEIEDGIYDIRRLRDAFRKIKPIDN